MPQMGKKEERNGVCVAGVEGCFLILCVSVLWTELQVELLRVCGPS
jgi:hypothetical protein